MRLSCSAVRPVGLVVLVSLLFVTACDRPVGEPVARSASAERRVILVTGSTSGLGREVAIELASPETHIIVHGRDEQRGREVVQAIEQAGGSASLHLADFASFDEVRALAETIRSDYDRLDVLINNAGVWLQAQDGRRTSHDGHEFHFQVNYLSHYLLTHLLLDRIVDSAPARIVNVASGAQRPIDFDNVMLESGYSDGRAYAQSKLAQVLMTVDLAQSLEDSGVVVTALHPATLMDTPMVLDRGARARSSVRDGADAVVNLVLSDDVESGAYYNGLSRARANDQAYDEQARERLRTLSAELTGLTYD
ncbi:MAG: SDR family NAD(P)-dependent oxidoreductase [Phycisphaeraceae bacterium]